MIKIENVQVMGWEPAIRGMRNPMNSWEKSDSWFWDCIDMNGKDFFHNINGETKSIDMYKESELLEDFVDQYKVIVGQNDLDLMQRLAAGGSVHAKYRRMLVCFMDVVAPLYWWKEADTYKVGTVANSCSTMHKIHSKEFALDDFSTDHLLEDEAMEFTRHLIKGLNFYRKRFLETKDKKYWWQMIQLLPSSYNQRRTLMLNYEVLSHIYKDRKDHKLDEWREFCEWIETLPFAKVLICNVAKGGETE